MILNDRRTPQELYRHAASSLGLQAKADVDDVRKAYRRTAHSFHPDQHVGEGKDALYSARFHLATAAKNLLLSRGSGDERKALEEYNKARVNLETAAKQAGVDPNTLERPATTQPSSASAARSREGLSDGYGPTRRTTSSTAAPGAASTAKKAPEGATYQRWTPPEFKREAPKTERPASPQWQSFRTETKATPRAENARTAEAPRSEPPRPQAQAATSEAPQPQSRTAEAPRSEPPRPQARTAEAPRPEAGPSFTTDVKNQVPRHTLRFPKEEMNLSPLASQQSPPASPQASVDPLVARAAKRAYESAAAPPSRSGRFDQWA